MELQASSGLMAVQKLFERWTHPKKHSTTPEEISVGTLFQLYLPLSKEQGSLAKTTPLFDPISRTGSRWPKPDYRPSPQLGAESQNFAPLHFSALRGPFVLLAGGSWQSLSKSPCRQVVHVTRKATHTHTHTHWMHATVLTPFLDWLA